MTDRIVTTPEDEARFAFDATHGVEPAQTIAGRIAIRYGFTSSHMIVDDIAHAIEDAWRIGEKRAALASAE